MSKYVTVLVSKDEVFGYSPTLVKARQAVIDLGGSEHVDGLIYLAAEWDARRAYFAQPGIPKYDRNGPQVFPVEGVYWSFDDEQENGARLHSEKLV